MRKIILITLLTTVYSLTHAQQWFDFGLKYGLSMAQLTNKNIFEDESINQELNFGHSFGAKFGFNLHEYHEITFDYMNNSTVYEYTFFTSTPKESAILDMKSNEYQLFYRHNKNGSYFELGPSITKVSSLASNRFDSKGNSLGSEENVINMIESSYPSLILGFGGYVLGTENIGLTIGFRFSYSWFDVLSEDGGKGNSNPFPSNYANGKAVSYDDYFGTHPFCAMMTTEINFDFAYIARAACRRAKLVLF